MTTKGLFSVLVDAPKGLASLRNRTYSVQVHIDPLLGARVQECVLPGSYARCTGGWSWMGKRVVCKLTNKCSPIPRRIAASRLLPVLGA